LIDANLHRLASLAAVQAGFPFRGAIADMPSGDVRVVQMKDVDPELGVMWHGCARTNLGGRKRPDWLRAGDLLFVAKGTRYYAVHLASWPLPAVCAPAFFHVRLHDTTAVDPAFIAWQINQPPCQRQLLQAAEGSNQLSIRRPALEQLMLSVPAIAEQRRIVALARLARDERQALHRLIHNREQQLQAIAESLNSIASPPSP
jgi:hypothetical protein